MIYFKIPTIWLPTEEKKPQNYWLITTSTNFWAQWQPWQKQSLQTHPVPTYFILSSIFLYLEEIEIESTDASKRKVKMKSFMGIMIL